MVMTSPANDLYKLERRMIDPDIMIWIFEWCPEGVVVVDREGIIYLFNTQAEIMFGYKRDEVIGHSVHMLLPERHRTIHDKFIGDYAAAPAVRPMGSGRVLAGRKKCGGEFPVEINLVPIFGRHGLLTAAFIRKTNNGGTRPL